MNAFAKLLGGVLRVLKTPLKLWSQQQKLTALITGLGVVFAGLATTTVVLHIQEPEPTETTPSTVQTTVAPTTTEPTTEPTTEATTTAPTEPQPVITEKVLELRELNTENPHAVGWIYIPNTRVDEVVMYSPDKHDYYLYGDFKGNFSASGLVYIDEVCSLEPETQVLQLYGHNMLSGTRFAGIFAYEKQSFYDKNPYIYFTTTEGARCYQVVTAGYDVYYKKSTENVYFFDSFVAPATKEEFDEHMAHFYERSEIETGVTATFEDNLIMLVTCAYQEKDGRFIVLAKEVPYVDPTIE